MAHQTFYRKYRPSKFSEVLGQEHVIATLENALKDDKLGHAYIFSGPRGTGKTSTARILAKTANCEQHEDGNCCDACESCIAFNNGSSLTVTELDAASNNKVEDIRELISTVGYATPGKRKFIILDEVHMLSTAASNAFLKTLEDPPQKVTFVMCTTDPQKILDTVKSRSQHLSFNLLGSKQLDEHVRWVLKDSNIELPDSDIAFVVKSGHGSVRDTLSALEQVVMAGGTPIETGYLDTILEAISIMDIGAIMVALNEALIQGETPRQIAEQTAEGLRNTFLASMNAPLPELMPEEAESFKEWSNKIPPNVSTMLLTELGKAISKINNSTSPRLELELAFLLAFQTTPEQPKPARPTSPSKQQKPAKQITDNASKPKQEPPLLEIAIKTNELSDIIPQKILDATFPQEPKLTEPEKPEPAKPPAEPKTSSPLDGLGSFDSEIESVETEPSLDVTSVDSEQASDIGADGIEISEDDGNQTSSKLTEERLAELLEEERLAEKQDESSSASGGTGSLF